MYQGVDYVDQLIVITIVPLVLIGCGGAIFILCKEFLRRIKAAEDDIENLRTIFISVLLFALYLVLPGLSVVLARSFPCVNVDPDFASHDKELYLR